MFVLLGNVVTQFWCGGWKNFTFERHKFLLVTVKEWLKSVLNYRSYPKNKTGYPVFCTTLYILHNMAARRVFNVIRSTKLPQPKLTKWVLSHRCLHTFMASILELINGSDTAGTQRYGHSIRSLQRNTLVFSHIT